MRKKHQASDGNELSPHQTNFFFLHLATYSLGFISLNYTSDWWKQKQTDRKTDRQTNKRKTNRQKGRMTINGVSFNPSFCSNCLSVWEDYLFTLAFLIWQIFHRKQKYSFHLHWILLLFSIRVTKNWNDVMMKKERNWNWENEKCFINDCVNSAWSQKQILSGFNRKNRTSSFLSRRFVTNYSWVFVCVRFFLAQRVNEYDRDIGLSAT